MIITVFAVNPTSTKPAGGWDQRAGFATEGDAVQVRRAEDRIACALVGAEPIWLGHSEADYSETRDELAIRREVWSAVDQMSAVLLPGFPLTNPDHALVTGLLVDDERPVEALGLYAEQPYRYWARRNRPRPSSLASPATATLGVLGWTRLQGPLRCLRTKRRAILEYRSQISLLGLDRGHPTRLDRLLAHELLSRGEAIVWLPNR